MAGFKLPITYVCSAFMVWGALSCPLPVGAMPQVPAPVVAHLEVNSTALHMRLQLAYELLSNGELLAALPLLEADLANPQASTNSELSTLLGYTHSHLGHYSLAKQHYLRALHLPKPDYVAVYGGLARQAFKQQQWDEAVTYQKHLISYAPLNAQHYHDLSVLHASALQYAQAVQASQQALTHGMKSALVYNNLGYALAKQGLAQQGLEAIDTALALDPDDPATQDSKGSAYLQLKNYQQALTWYDKALTSDPALAETYWHRAQVWQALAQPAKALHDIEIFLQLSPNADDAPEAKILAQQLRQRKQNSLSTTEL